MDDFINAFFGLSLDISTCERLEKEGLMEFTGNQWNPDWKFKREALAQLSNRDLHKLYETLKMSVPTDLNSREQNKSDPVRTGENPNSEITLKYYLISYAIRENGYMIGTNFIPLFKFPSINLIHEAIMKTEAVTNPETIQVIAISVLSEEDYKALTGK